MSVARVITILILLVCSLGIAQKQAASPPSSTSKITSPPLQGAKPVSKTTTLKPAKCDPDRPDLDTDSEPGQPFDFDPTQYVSSIKPKIRNAWFELTGSDTWMKKACVVVEFKIRRDGGVSALSLLTSSGDLQLDRAALGAIVSTAPFGALPSQSTKADVTCRWRFYYNPGEGKVPEKSPVQGERMTAPDDEPIVRETDVIPPAVIYSPNSAHALMVVHGSSTEDQKVKGRVLLTAVVTSKGDVASAEITQSAGNGFDENAMANVLMSKFKPATHDGNPVRTQVQLQVDMQ